MIHRRHIQLPWGFNLILLRYLIESSEKSFILLNPKMCMGWNHREVDAVACTYLVLEVANLAI